VTKKDWGEEFKVSASPKGGETEREAYKSWIKAHYDKDMKEAREAYGRLRAHMDSLSEVPTAAELDKVRNIAKDINLARAHTVDRRGVSYLDKDEAEIKDAYKFRTEPDDISDHMWEDHLEKKEKAKEQAILEHNRAMRERLRDTDPAIISSRYNHPFTKEARTKEAREAAAKKATDK
jgi:hypothetical protein